jgi:hypothetical protein
MPVACNTVCLQLAALPCSLHTLYLLDIQSYNPPKVHIDMDVHCIKFGGSDETN